MNIGVFDSGFGGLTVLRALLPLIPSAHYIYLGDTARLPYGSKSHETIARYAVSSAKFLHEQGAELLVIACNTATALALEDIQQALPIPVIGVVEPGAQAANNTTNHKHLGLKTDVILTPSELIEPRGKTPAFCPASHQSLPKTTFSSSPPQPQSNPAPIRAPSRLSAWKQPKKPAHSSSPW